MELNKEELYRLVDAVPQSEWDDVEKYLKIKAMPTFTPTSEELEAIRLAEIDEKNGDLISLNDLMKGTAMKTHEELFEAVKSLSNGERIKFLGKMYDEYFDNRPSEQVMEAFRKWYEGDDYDYD